MKTGEMYMMALANPNAKFHKVRNNLDYYFNELGMLYTENSDRSVEPPIADEDWELVPETVDFMTAINSGKMIKSCVNEHFHTVEWYLEYSPSLKEINGNWQIEQDEQ